MFAKIAEAHRRTRKPRDIVWNRFVARPLASVLVVPLQPTAVTPNQVTFASLIVFAAAMAWLVVGRGHLALVGAAALLEVSYVLDCVDGQLARVRGRSTPIGAHLDFLMDELKAFLLVGAVGLRLWGESGDVAWLHEAVAGVVVVAAAISLTTFVRRPEYAAATGTAVQHGAGDYGEGFAPAQTADSTAPARRSPVAAAVGAVESVGKLLVHYPSYIWLVALADRLDLFMHAYVAINAAYAGRTLLAVARKLGRSDPPPGENP